MKKFLKYSVYTAALFSFTFLSACSDDIRDVTVPGDDSEQGEGRDNVEMKDISINASINNSSNTNNTGLKSKWVVEDVIYVGTPSASETEVTIDNENSGFKKFSVSKMEEGSTSATFIGKVPTDISGKKLMAFYGNPSSIKVSGGKVKLDFTSQNQDAADSSLLSSVSDYNGEESLDMSLNNEGAAININMEDVSERGKTLKEVSLSLPEGSQLNFFSLKEYDVEGNVTATPNNNITIKMSANEDKEDNKKNNKATVIVCPSASDVSSTITVSLTAETASGDYTYTNSMETSVATGSNYSIELKEENKDKTLKGNGTAESPYIIDNIDKLQSLNTQRDREYKTETSNYILSRNLDCEGIENFTPITTFNGVFDGNNMTISNLKMELGDGNGGLFAENNGTIKNLKFKDVKLIKNGKLNKDEAVGIIVGKNNKYIKGCIISDSELNAKISHDGTDGDRNLGILTGVSMSGGSISECTVESSKISVSGTSKCNIGGLVGKNQSTIDNSFVEESVEVKLETNTSGSNLGGFIGYSNICKITGCYSKANVSSNTGNNAITIAGFIGSAWTAKNATTTITGCYSTGKVNSGFNNNTHGGFVGSLDGKGTKVLTNCYTTSTCKENSAFVFNGKVQTCTIKDCYFTSGTQTNCDQIKQKKASDLKNMVETFNNPSIGDNYTFTSGTTDEEPLVIVKK